MTNAEGGRFEAVISKIDAVTFGACVGGSICLAGIFILVALEVLSRNILGTSIPFSWDFSAYMMGGCFLLSSGNALKSGSHVRVTALFDVLSPRGVVLLNLAACAVGFAIACVLTYALGNMAYLSFVRGSAAATVVKTPLWIPQGVMTVGAAVFVLQLVAQFLRALRGEMPMAHTSIEEAV